MYLIQVDHVVYEPVGGGTFTLPQALTEVHGVANARILRVDGTPVVESAGSDVAQVQHAPTGRTVSVRRARHAHPIGA